MKKIKVLITGIVMIGTILVAGLAHAATTNVTVTFDVESVTVLTSCSLIDLGTFTVHQGKDTSVSPCNVVAASNDPDGFTVALRGTSNGLYNTDASYEWDKLLTTSDTMDTGCTSACEEEWGWRVTNGTASEYDVVENDLDNNNNNFAAISVWHTANTANEIFITNSSPTADNTANFDLELGLVSGFQASGLYEETLTLTLTL